MKTLGWPAAVVASVIMASCGSSRHADKGDHSLPGTWQAQPITIDGDSKDWPSPYPSYDAKAMVAYATSNDRKYLYITMETGDELTQTKILKQGLTVTIDTSGKKDGTFHINYPLQNDEGVVDLTDEIDFKTGHTNSRFEQKIKKVTKESTQYSLEGFTACNGGFAISQTTACGIKVKMSLDEYKELVWEAAVPVKALYGIDSLPPSYAGRPISVGFIVKGFHQKSKSDKNNENGGGGMSPAMGGGQGMGGMGGGRGGRGGGGGGRMQAEDPKAKLYETTKTWKQFGLAIQ